MGWRAGGATRSLAIPWTCSHLQVIVASRRRDGATLTLVYGTDNSVQAAIVATARAILSLERYRLYHPQTTLAADATEEVINWGLVSVRREKIEFNLFTIIGEPLTASTPQFNGFWKS